jgi:transketolase
VLTPEQESAAINLIRGFAMDAPLYAKSGHQGTAMALAPLAHVLYSRVMNFDPADSGWPDRDRFVLSNGHASILQYSMLYLTGFGLTLDDIKAFRSWESATPGHPEVGVTNGVEVTTGPLGQGFANSVGMAIAERYLRAKFGADVQNHNTFVFAGDGCFMEGVSHEAASLAGHLKLGGLVCVYDDNHITIDGNTELAYSDDVAMRFEAYGWHVEKLGEMANDCDGLEAALRRGVAVTDRPSLLILRSHIAYPSPDHLDDHEAHGNPFTAEQVSRTKEIMGIPDEPFWAPDDLVAAYRKHAGERGVAKRAEWQARFEASTIDKSEWEACWSGTGLPGWADSLPTFQQGEKIATRVAIQKTFDATIGKVPGLVAGAADLTGNTGTKLSGQTQQTAATPGGRQVYYGVREHGMGSSMVGMALHGGVIPAGGTFFVFLDYMRPAVRLSTISHAKVLFVYTHDSVGVGEDGPTHQPVEHIATLRAIPHLQVIRPADANETAQAWKAVVDHRGPTALVLSRQAIPVCTDGRAVDPGAATIVEAAEPDIVIVGTGSEVSLCIEAAAQLAEAGVQASVVSMPSWDRFEAQPHEYRISVFPEGVPVLSVEAATTFGWDRYADDSIGIDRFGASAPGALVLDKLGINVDNIVARAQLLAKKE